MPTYEYACTSCGHHLEAVQSFSDDPLTTCPSCGAPLRKVFGTIGIVLKGSGFYKTDSRSSPPGKAGSDRTDAKPGTDGSPAKDSPAAKESGGSESGGSESGGSESGGSESGGSESGGSGAGGSGSGGSSDTGGSSSAAGSSGDSGGKAKAAAT